MTPEEITDLIVETAGVERLMSDIITGWDYTGRRDVLKQRFLIDGTEQATHVIADTIRATDTRAQIEGPSGCPVKGYESRLVLWVKM